MLSVGQEVEVKLTDVDFEKKRISLSMKALLSGSEADGEDAEWFKTGKRPCGAIRMAVFYCAAAKMLPTVRSGVLGRLS